MDKFIVGMPVRYIYKSNKWLTKDKIYTCTYVDNVRTNIPYVGVFADNTGSKNAWLREYFQPLRTKVTDLLYGVTDES